MTICIVRWKDACQVEATNDEGAIPQLAELCEVGFLLAEDEETLLIGMECSAEDVQPGRWRLNIPKCNIVDRYDFPFKKLTAKKKVKAPKKPSSKNAKNETTRQLLSVVSDCEQQGSAEACASHTTASA